MLFLIRNCIRGLIPSISALKGGVLNPSARIKTGKTIHFSGNIGEIGAYLNSVKSKAVIIIVNIAAVRIYTQTGKAAVGFFSSGQKFGVFKEKSFSSFDE